MKEDEDTSVFAGLSGRSVYSVQGFRVHFLCKGSYRDGNQDLQL